jgi:hypothetical protein
MKYAHGRSRLHLAAIKGVALADNGGGQYVWRFFRAGGFDQVRIDRGSDITNLKSLDQKLWAALACPTRGVEFDERTLGLIDAWAAAGFVDTELGVFMEPEVCHGTTEVYAGVQA